VERLPGDARALSVIALAAVKERLGLPEDADPTQPPGGGGGEVIGPTTGLSAAQADCLLGPTTD
jgi:hypothetical protein